MIELSATEFHSQAFNIINTAVNGAKNFGLNINTMPPHLSVIEATPIYEEDGHTSLLVSSGRPEILQDTDPNIWSFLAKNLINNSEAGIGFVFWCLMDSPTESNLIFGLSYQLGGDYYAFLCDKDFKSLRSVDPAEVMPYLYDNYEQEIVLH